MIKHFCDEWIKEWCEENGWTDLFIERYNNYWAFPPGAVIPEPIPAQTLRLIKAEKGLCFQEKMWLTSAVILTVIAAIVSYILKSPMPIVFAFAFDSITSVQLEVEDC